MNKPLWITLSILYALFGLVSVGGALLSFMLFDAPGSASSPWTIAFFVSLLAFPLFWFAGALLPWCFRSKSFSGWLFLIPAVDAIAIAVILGAIVQFCSGMLSCK